MIRSRLRWNPDRRKAALLSSFREALRFAAREARRERDNPLCKVFALEIIRWRPPKPLIKGVIINVLGTF